MKEVKAFISPNKVNKIVQHLKEAGIDKLTSSMAEGTGNFQDEKAFVSQKFSNPNSEIAKLEIVAKEDSIDIPKLQ